MRIRTRAASLTAAIATASLAACSTTGTTLPAIPVTAAAATLVDTSGKPVGTARFTQDLSGPVVVQVDVTGLPPGNHGIHFHSVGSCAASGATPFGGAGAHFNPMSKLHGLENPRGPHAGDLPNLVVAANGTGELRTTTDRLTLTSGPLSVFDADGTALVIHAAPDDQVTDPAGNSGARIACGVITRL